MCTVCTHVYTRTSRTITSNSVSVQVYVVNFLTVCCMVFIHILDFSVWVWYACLRMVCIYWKGTSRIRTTPQHVKYLFVRIVSPVVVVCNCIAHYTYVMRKLNLCLYCVTHMALLLHIILLINFYTYTIHHPTW
jgi:hypothetical protein